jgi:hypothetical protein
MLTKDVLKHYGTRAEVARKIGYTRQAIYRWKRIVPEQAAYRIERDTGGKFRVDPAVYRTRA